jgi:DNA polymerase-3 subunit epsilon
VDKAVVSFREEGGTAAIIGRGRSDAEQSLVLVEKGSYVGFGYFDREVSISDFESARIYVKPGYETTTVQNLINSYLTNPRDASVVMF